MGQTNSHSLLGYTLRGQVEGLDADTAWSALVQEMEASDAQMAVLSAEVFANLSQRHVDQLAGYLTGYEVSVLYYLRDPIKLTLSQYTQGVRAGRWSGPFSSFIDANESGISGAYGAAIDRWERAFGVRVRVHSFDEVVVTHGLERDVLQLLDFDYEEYQWAFSVRAVNTSLSNEAVRLLRFVNLVERLTGDSNAMRNILDLSRGVVARMDCTARSSLLRRAVHRWLGGPLYTSGDLRRIERLADNSVSALRKLKRHPTPWGRSTLDE